MQSGKEFWLKTVLENERAFLTSTQIDKVLNFVVLNCKLKNLCKLLLVAIPVYFQSFNWKLLLWPVLMVVGERLTSVLRRMLFRRVHVRRLITEWNWLLKRHRLIWNRPNTKLSPATTTQTEDRTHTQKLTPPCGTHTIVQQKLWNITQQHTIVGNKPWIQGLLESKVNFKKRGLTTLKQKLLLFNQNRAVGQFIGLS